MITDTVPRTASFDPIELDELLARAALQDRVDRLVDEHRRIGIVVAVAVPDAGSAHEDGGAALFDFTAG